MRKRNKSFSKYKSRLLLVTSILLTIAVTFFFQNKISKDPEVIKQWLSSYGVFTILAYLVLQSITIVIAPLGGFAATVAMWAIYGPILGSFLIYLIATPLYAINFLIARKWGRKIVLKLIGKGYSEKVFNVSEKLSPRILVFLKLFMGGNFDYLSYAAGLSNISFKQYILINYLAGIPGMIILTIVLLSSPNFGSGIAFIYILPLIFGSIYVIFKKRLKKIFKLDQIPFSDLQ